MSTNPRSAAIRAAITMSVPFLTVSAPSATAVPLEIDAQYTATGPSYAIGTLLGSVDAAGNETGTFTLNAPYRSLMNDAAGLQFRYFQVITYDDEPVKWMGSIITPAGTANHVGDVVDPPAGGWDYQLTSGNKGGADNSPFYENDTTNNPSTGKPYYYPGYPTQHSPDGVNPGTASTDDAPGLSNKNDKTLFETFIAYEDPIDLEAMEVDILGGYSWGIQTDASNVKSGIAPTYIPYSDITLATLTELQGALDRSGFGDWLVYSSDVFLAPEPGTLALLGTGLIGVAIVRRRKADQQDRRNYIAMN